MDRILNSAQVTLSDDPATGKASASPAKKRSLLESMSTDEQKWANWLAKATA